ncbi:uncharacterized protein F4807DRAFT_457240 [Annulohypoxylon truncatum]|uniref:uncharacterized protein n=1 Tax=Annulohypoxylon truncatum TaxID=327061 RepID=UPI002007CDF6|nr:uncharacterized protein F4807DRAFT_457240 [Annulohypoxylon truncatum]KAI1213155.1 hypothetical protein F4807DRAFT_457240 [Annulohypoxylon truncatum]
MNNKLHVWLEEKPHSVEGHTAKCTLYFKDRQVWGPVHCHGNTEQLRDAIQKADDRFALTVEPRSKSVEGHIRYISVKSHGNVLLDKLSTHDNMEGLVTVIEALLNVLG